MDTQTISATPSAPTIDLRLADSADGHAVRELADLDGAPVPHAPVLLALMDGHARAALSLRDGHVVATPFALTGDAVSLLRLRAAQLSQAGAPHGSRRARERRLGLRRRGRRVAALTSPR